MDTLVALGLGVVCLAIPLAFVASLLWVAGDAGGRGLPGCIVALLVAVTWPLGFVIYYIARPVGTSERRH